MCTNGLFKILKTKAQDYHWKCSMAEEKCRINVSGSNKRVGVKGFSLPRGQISCHYVPSERLRFDVKTLSERRMEGSKETFPFLGSA
jgi:hypothetical protein